MSQPPPQQHYPPIYKDEQRTQRLRTLAAQLSVIQMQAAQVMRNATWTDAHGNTWEAIQGAGGKFVKIVLVSHGPGQEHIGPIGTERGVHEAARMLREKERLSEEKQPNEPLAAKHSIDMRDLNAQDNADPRNLELMRQAYGDEQIARAIHGYTTSTLRSIAEKLGIDTKGIRTNHDALVTAIVAHVTRDEATGIPRYSADFGKSASGKGESAGKADANFRANGMHKPLTSDQVDEANHDFINYKQTYRGDMYSPATLRGYTHGDMERVYRLVEMMTGAEQLEVVQRLKAAAGMKDIAGLSNKANAQEITEALDRHFNGDKASWGRNGQVTSTDEHPFAAEYRARLAQLRADAEKSGYHEANPAAKKAADALTKAISGGKGGKASGKTARPEIETHLTSALNEANAHDPLAVWKAFGGNKADVQAVLEKESPGRLILLLRDPKMPTGPEPRAQTSRALAKTIAERLDHHFNGEQSSTAKTAGAEKKGSGTGQRLDELHPVRGLPKGLNIGTFRVPNPYILTYYYGSKQVRTALEAFPIKDLKESAKLVQERNPGTSPKSTSKRDDLLDYILSHVSEDQAVAVVNELASNSGQRATLPDLTPFARTLAAIHADLRRIA